MKGEWNQILIILSIMKWVMPMKKLKRNTVPFLILFIIHTCLLGFSFYKNKNKKQIFTLLMSNIGFAYLLEFFVLNLSNAYSYRPKVMKKKILDNILGAILSQAIFVPFTAVFLTAGKIGWRGKFLAGFYFSLVEISFLRLGVYKHHWWKTSYTFILMPIYFKISDLWNNFLGNINPLVRFVSLFLTIMVTEANLLFIFASRRKLRFGFGRYHSWREHFIIVPLFAIALSLFSTWSFWKKNSWTVKLRVLLFTIGLYKLFRGIKLIKSNFRWFEYLVIRIIVIMLYGQFRDWVHVGDRSGGEISVVDHPQTE